MSCHVHSGGAQDWLSLEQVPSLTGSKVASGQLSLGPEAVTLTLLQE